MKTSGYKSAVTGRFVSEKTAKANPKQTYLDTFDLPLELTSTRVKENLKEMIHMLENSPMYTGEDEHDLETLKLLV